MKENIPYGRLDSRYMLKSQPIYSVSDVQNITASGGLTVTDGLMRIQGSGGPVVITANPQISPGELGQILFVQGENSTNTVTFTDGNGLRLRYGSIELGAHDIIQLIYDVGESRWEEITRGMPENDESWSFRNRTSSGTDYIGGFYIFNSGNDDFTTTQTIGAANLSYAAHAFVVLGESTDNDLTIRFSGTSINDQGVRVTSDTQDVVFSHPAVPGAYAETSKKWLGQVSIDHISGNAKQFNWGLCKYWDSNNSDFVVRGLEVTWIGGANDSNPDIQLIHHKPVGWAYNVGSTPSPPTAIVTMATDHGTERRVATGVEGAWKRDDLNKVILGGNSEGTIFAIITTANNAFSIGNILLRIRPY